MTTMATITIDWVQYKTHAEVMHKFFGWTGKLYLGAEQSVDDDYSVWFPVVSLCQNKNSPQSKASHNGWYNCLDNNLKTIRQYWPKPTDKPPQHMTNKKRITFAKYFAGNKYWYVFIGVFEKVRNMPDHTEYRRIAEVYP